jgi:hypothetical protein
MGLSTKILRVTASGESLCATWTQRARDYLAIRPLGEDGCALIFAHNSIERDPPTLIFPSPESAKSFQRHIIGRQHARTATLISQAPPKPAPIKPNHNTTPRSYKESLNFWEFRGRWGLCIPRAVGGYGWQGAAPSPWLFSGQMENDEPPGTKKALPPSCARQPLLALTELGAPSCTGGGDWASRASNAPAGLLRACARGILVEGRARITY